MKKYTLIIIFTVIFFACLIIFTLIYKGLYLNKDIKNGDIESVKCLLCKASLQIENKTKLVDDNFFGTIPISIKHKNILQIEENLEKNRKFSNVLHWDLLFDQKFFYLQGGIVWYFDGFRKRFLPTDEPVLKFAVSNNDSLHKHAFVINRGGELTKEVVVVNYNNKKYEFNLDDYKDISSSNYNRVRDLSFSSDDKKLYISSDIIMIYDFEKEEITAFDPVPGIKHTYSYRVSSATSPNGRYAVIHKYQGDTGDEKYMIDLQEKKPIMKFDQLTFLMFFLDDEKYLAYSFKGYNGAVAYVEVYDISGKKIKDITKLYGEFAVYDRSRFDYSHVYEKDNPRVIFIGPTLNNPNIKEEDYELNVNTLEFKKVEKNTKEVICDSEGCGESKIENENKIRIYSTCILDEENDFISNCEESRYFFVLDRENSKIKIIDEEQKFTSYSDYIVSK